MTALLGGSATTSAVRQQVWAALDTVRDPELDEPITDLNFVTAITVTGSAVSVRLRLPTYFCAPNFAYLMVADSYDAVSALPGVESVSVRLDDHFASEEINGGVEEGAGFSGSFPGQAVDELDELRSTFQRKAHLASLDRVAKRLLREGWALADLGAVRVRDLPAGPERESLLRRRTDIGLDVYDDDLVLVDPTGTPVTADKLPMYLRFATSTRVSIEGNGIFCRGLLDTRYGSGDRVGTLSGIEPEGTAS